MTASHFKTCLVLACLSFGRLAAANAAANAAESNADLNAQLDINNDGKLERSEVKLGLKHLLKPDSVNLPAIRAKKQLPKGLEEDQDLNDRYDIFLLTVGHPPPYALGEIDPREFGLSKSYRPGPTDAEIAQERYKQSFDIKVRRSVDDLTKKITDAYAQGALFSYGHDYRAKEETWTARGVVGLSYSLIENGKYDPNYAQREDGKSTVPPREPNVNFVHSVDGLFTFAFDRLKTTKGSAFGTDNLQFGLHLVTDLAPGYQQARQSWRDLNATALAGGTPDPTQMKYPFFKSLLVDVSGTYSTDSNFERNIPSLAVDLTPGLDLWGMNSFQPLFAYRRNASGQAIANLFAARWDVTAHFEAGSVQDAGTTTPTYFATKDFARIGGRGSVEILILPEALDQRLSCQVGYNYYYSLTRDAESTKLFNATGQFVLPIGAGRFAPTKSGALAEKDIIATLRVEYQDGQIPITLERDRSLVIGLGILY